MRAYLTISGVFFGLIAVGHILRLFQGWPAQVGTWTVPFWVSWLAVLVPGALCLWAFRLLRTSRPMV